jgi:hypothetical protein
MSYTRTPGFWLQLALSAGLAGCEAQASEAYLGEPLLQLHGSAVITSETGGEAVAPALCFSKGGPSLLPDSAQSLPEEVREALAGTIEAGEELNANADTVGVWLPGNIVEIVEVESVGQFPADFNIEAYLPPSDELVQPIFEGEPPLAQGFLCAVREGHPDVVHAPQILPATNCESGEEGPCDRYYVFLSHDSDAYFAETFHCPSAHSPSSECERTTYGEIAVRRNFRGSFIEGSALPVVVYLAQPAKAGSYTAWKYGAANGLSAGFHLFRRPPLQFDLLGSLGERDPCKSARGNARRQTQEENIDRWVTIEIGGVLFDNLEVDPVLREAYERRTAELTMANCPMPEIELISHTEPLEVRFSNPPPVTFDGLPPTP